jgi:hypothetical protein
MKSHFLTTHVDCVQVFIHVMGWVGLGWEFLNLLCRVGLKKPFNSIHAYNLNAL